MNCSSIDIAVDWWTNVLRDGAKHDDGDHDLGTLGLHAIYLNSIPKPTEGQITRFAQVLRIKAESVFQDLGENAVFILGSDYGPKGLLREAAEAAGIDAALFPEKTTMWVRRESVRLAYGYGAPVETIYGVWHKEND